MFIRLWLKYVSLSEADVTAPALFQEPALAPETQEPQQSQESQAGAEVFDPDVPTVEAPYGYTLDPDSGEYRPKKTAGRRSRNAPPLPKPTGVSPSLEDLKAAAAAGPAPKRREDIPPQAPARVKVQFGKAPGNPAKPPEQVPPFRAGPIAKGMNRLYRRAGKIVRIWDPQVGAAIISCTVPDIDDDDGLTVGEAYEELAKVNPRIRAFLLKAVSGGAWGALFMAHGPFFLAVLMKDSIRNRIPLVRLVDAFTGDEDQEQGSDGFPAGMFGGMGPEDAAQMMAMAQGMMAGMAGAMPRGMNDGRPAEQGEQAA